MDKVRNIINKLGKPFKTAIIMAVIVIGLLVGLSIYGNIREAQKNKTPIVSITAENSESYDAKITKSDFTITATHEDGATTDVDPADVKISPKYVNSYGTSTEVTVSLKDDPKIQCKAKVKNHREKVLSFDVGIPNAKDVRAVLYTDGELCFEGKGDVAHYEEGYYPWQTYNLDDDGKNTGEYTEVFGVTFQKDVKPTNMDSWFQNCQDLEYVGKIPDSVQSMANTFQNCTYLKHGPDWSDCKNLIDTSSCFSGCTALTDAYDLPKTVRNSSFMYNQCYSLVHTPIIHTADKLKTADNAFTDCDGIIDTDYLPKTVQSMDSMYSGCINLKKMPKIPKNVTNMNAAFYNCSMLTTVTNIPKNVTNVTDCFNNCSQINGTLKIDANPTEFEQFLANAAYATSLNLTGKSKLLDALANTDENTNVYVKKKKPDPNITTYEDVFPSY